MCSFTGLFIEGGSPAKRVSEAVLSVLDRSDASITGPKEEADGSVIQLAELC